jgi:hypothetical protein
MQRCALSRVLLDVAEEDVLDAWSRCHGTCSIFCMEKMLGKNKAGGVFMTCSFCEDRPLDDQQLLSTFSCWLMCVQAVVNCVL